MTKKQSPFGPICDSYIRKPKPKSPPPSQPLALEPQDVQPYLQMCRKSLGTNTAAAAPLYSLISIDWCPTPCRPPTFLTAVPPRCPDVVPPLCWPPRRRASSSPVFLMPRPLIATHPSCRKSHRHVSPCCPCSQLALPKPMPRWSSHVVATSNWVLRGPTHPRVPCGYGGR